MASTRLSSLFADIEELEQFARHPVRAYDPFYTRDIYLFESAWSDFLEQLRAIVASNPTDMMIRWAQGLYFDAVYKIRSYERATGISLLGVDKYSKYMKQPLDHLWSFE